MPSTMQAGGQKRVNTNNDKCHRGCGGLGTLKRSWCGWKMEQLLAKQFLRKLNIELPRDPAIHNEVATQEK